VMRALDNAATITGTAGAIVIDDPWVPGRDAPPSDATIRVRRGGEETVERLACPEQLFVFEARMATRAVAEGALEAPHPAASHADSLGNARTLDRWRACLGYKVASERRATSRALPRVLPPGLPPVPTVAIPGLDRPVSQLILGCDNRDTLAEGAVV
ncbi:oxidoreductase, partial [Corallococcus praedator]